MMRLADPFRCLRDFSQRRALHFGLLFFLTAFAIPASAHTPVVAYDARQAIQDSLSVHRGTGDGLVFPRDALAAQPAIETRKKNFKGPIGIADGDAALSATRTPPTDIRFSPTIARRFNAFSAVPPLPWHSRAPPNVN
jgi:hypothetical protein